MKIADFATRARRTTEATFERRVAAALKEAGIYSRHMSDKLPGLPDRYVAGGIWIEFKSLYRVRGGFTVGEGLTAEQRRCMADLHKAGEIVFYCALCDTGQEQKIAFVRWDETAIDVKDDKISTVEIMSLQKIVTWLLHLRDHR